MSHPDKPPEDVEPPSAGLQTAKQMMSRLMASMPAATFEMETFARLAGVVASDDVPTAAMECKYRPRLLLNPKFVAEYCKRDEHLFLLVMHELWHVMLAHTNLYPRVTQAQNIAFDAIINAGLSRRFSKPAYRGFFEKLNPADKFPHILLRPPVGWPDNPQYPTDVGPKGTVRILRQLYPPKGAFRPAMPFYDEILDLIREHMRQNGMLIEVPVLLGHHGDNDPYKDTFLRDAMGRMTKKWPMRAGEFGPPGQGVDMDNWRVDPYSSTQEVRRVFANVLRRCLTKNLGEYRRKERRPIPGITGTGVLPNSRDRMIHSKRLLGLPTTIWSQKGTFKARVPEKRVKAHIYIDVSGSMSEVLPYLLSLIVPYVRNGLAEVFQFSTRVAPMPLEDLQRGTVRSSFGTQINCVLKHVITQEEVIERVLVITDGFVGQPFAGHVANLNQNGTRFDIVLPHETHNEADLRDMAASMIILPPLS